MLGQIVAHDLELGSEAHVSDLRLDVTEDGLEELVLLLQDQLVV